MAHKPLPVHDCEICPMCGKHADLLVAFDPVSGMRVVICKPCLAVLNTTNNILLRSTKPRSARLPKYTGEVPA